MRTIETSDVIFATIQQHGRTIYTTRICGVSSMADIVRHISSDFGTIMGMFTLNLRNGSQGWTTSTNLRLQQAA